MNDFTLDEGERVSMREYSESNVVKLDGQVRTLKVQKFTLYIISNLAD